MLVFAPLLVYRGLVHEDAFIVLFGCGLFLVDAFCIAFLAPDAPRQNRGRDPIFVV